MTAEISEEIKQLYKRIGRLGYNNQRLELEDITAIMGVAEKETDFTQRCIVVHSFIKTFKEGIEDFLYEDSPYCSSSIRSKYS